MQILYFHEFIQELEGKDKKAQNQIKGKLRELHRLPPEQHVPLPLKGAQFKGLYKLRVGDWRLIYRIFERELHFVTLGHRSEIYRS